MNVGIIGAGKIGEAAATRLVAAGHHVMISNSRSPETLADLEQSLGQDATAGTVIDANNYYPQRDGQIAELDSGEIGSSELLARKLPGARVVKAFNTMLYRRLMHEGRPRGAADRLAIPLAGDDAQAREMVARLIDDMGFDPIDAGTLADGRDQEPGTSVYNNPVVADRVREALGCGRHDALARSA